MSRFRSRNPTIKTCPHCGSIRITKRIRYIPGYHCNTCRKEFKQPKVVYTARIRIEKSG